MTIKEAIEKAIEGGWKRPEVAYVFGGDAMEDVWAAQDRDEVFQVENVYLTQEILLDPTFWQALGKTQGYVAGEPFYIERRGDPQWLTRMHRLIDALASGKTIEEFFATL